MWRHRDIPKEFGWMIIALIPEGDANIRRIGLLKSLWKVVEVIIDTCLRVSVCLYGILHGLRTGRGTGTAILGLKLVQELTIVDQDLLLLVFIYLLKVYYTVDCGHLLETLNGYRSGPHVFRILAEFWHQQDFVARQNSYHGPHFKSSKGNTKGGLVPPTFFNPIVYNVIRDWIDLKVEYQLVAQEGLLLAVGRCMGIFYAENVVVVFWNPEWNQCAMNVLFNPYLQYGLVANISKSNSMTFQMGTLWSDML